MCKLSLAFNEVIEELMPTDGKWINTFDEYRRDTRDILDKEGSKMREIMATCTEAYSEPLASRMRSAIYGATDAEIEYAEARFRSIFTKKFILDNGMEVKCTEHQARLWNKGLCPEQLENVTFLIPTANDRGFPCTLELTAIEIEALEHTDSEEFDKHEYLLSEEILNEKGEVVV